MKVFYIANVKLPSTKAHGAQIMKMCEAFMSAGLEMELITAGINGDIFQYYGIGRRFKAKRIVSLDFGRVGFLGRWAHPLQALSFSFGVFIYFLLKSREIKKDDIIYFRGDYSFAFPSLLKKNIFLEIHNFSKRLENYYKKTFVKLKGLVLLTKKAKEEFMKIGIKEERILIAPDAVDLDMFDINISREEARANLKLPQNKKIIVYTGKFKTMGMDKGISDILKALTRLNDNIIFVAAGGSEEDMDYYKKITAELNIADRAYFVGHVPQSELAVYQKAADALLMPFPRNEHYAYYMSPLKMFEYMVGKRPIITTDLPSIREVLNENNAVIAKPDNPEDLARGIEKVLSDRSLAERISEQAFRDIQKYTWIKRAENIMEFIKRNKD